MRGTASLERRCDDHAQGDADSAPPNLVIARRTCGHTARLEVCYTSSSPFADRIDRSKRRHQPWVVVITQAPDMLQPQHPHILHDPGQHRENKRVITHCYLGHGQSTMWVRSVSGTVTSASVSRRSLVTTWQSRKAPLPRGFGTRVRSVHTWSLGERI